MELRIRTFEELSVRELYALLKARVDVFVVEQNCPYPELDGVDLTSLHLFYAEADGTVAAYLRLFSRPGEPGTVRLGRMLTVRRGRGLGGELLRAGIRAAFGRLGAEEICLDAQTYAVGFYRREGFRVTSGEFLEDGIPHVQMRLRKGEGANDGAEG